jgi:hypothetical protein
MDTILILDTETTGTDGNRGCGRALVQGPEDRGGRVNADDTIEIGDTFEHETEPGRAWEVTERRKGGLFVLDSGPDYWVVPRHVLLGSSRWRRCEARAVCA